jgi:glyoxylase-like metal-dependent hydrolase (beta-lactamase superfamily II)
MTFIGRLLCGLILYAAGTTHTAAQEITPEITNLRGDLYQVRHGAQVTVFLVTSEGIILGDPLNLAAARWLKNELVDRFPEKLVQHVIYSHHYFERASGAGIFEPSAELMGHEEFNREVARARRTLPSIYEQLDANRDQILNRDELSDRPAAAALRSLDRDGDGAVTSSELYADVRDAETTFKTRRTITLGDGTVELIHPGEANALDMTALYFPSERVMFAADYPAAILTSPLSFGSSAAKEIIEWVAAVEPLDWDLLVSGDGTTLARTDIGELARYLADLNAAVAAGYEAGRTIAELQGSPVLESYRRSPRFALLDDHIASLYRTLRLVRVDLYGAALLNAVPANNAYCMSFTTCDAAGGATGAGAVGLTVAGRRLGLTAEARIGGQFLGARTSPLYDDAFAHRDTAWSVLFRYTLMSRGGLKVSGVVGTSLFRGDLKGMDVVKQGVSPAGGPHPLAFKTSGGGFTTGVDLDSAVGRSLSVVMPVRLTSRTRNRAADWLGNLDLHAGIGIGIRLFQRVQ